MEGKYMTQKQRDKLADDNRRSHFVLGNAKPDPVTKSELKPEKCYNRFALARAMRSTHFILGTDRQVKHSETKSRFTPFEVPTKSIYGKHTSTLFPTF